MKQLQHMLFVTEPETRLHLSGGAAEVVDRERVKHHFPLHNLLSAGQRLAGAD